MSQPAATAGCEPLRMRMSPTLRHLTDHEFFEFCQLNRDWRIERTSAGDIILMPPTGGTTGRRNAEVIRQLANWAKVDSSGILFDSSTGFALPNGAKRSPDVAWVTRERWHRLPPQAQEEFPPLCPDFVVELRSPSDALDGLRTKMAEYLANGTQLGWLIDPSERCVYVYCAGKSEERLENPQSISGEPLLPGLQLELRDVW